MFRHIVQVTCTAIVLMMLMRNALAQTPPAGIWKAAYDGDMAAVQVLLNENPELALATEPQAGTTALHWAAFGERVDVIALLIECGARVDARNLGGGTPLQGAAAVGADAVVKLLLEKGADVAARDADGKSARDWAVEKGHASCAAMLADAEAAFPSVWPTERRLTTPPRLVDLDGKDVDFAALGGKVVVLCLWTESALPLSFENLAIAQSLSNWPEAVRGDLVVLAPTPDSVQQARKFLAAKSYTGRVVLDPTGEFKLQLQLVDRPVVVIDRQGEITWCRRRASLASVSDAVRRALEARLEATNERLTTTGTAPNVSNVENFEDEMQDWTMTGDCWELAPSSEAEFPGLVKGYIGKGFINTIGGKGCQVSGIARSPEFRIELPYIHLLVGGNDVPERGCVALVVGGVVARIAVGRYSAELVPTTWDVRELAGQTASIEIIDAGKEDYRDFMLVDEIVQSDSPMPPGYMLNGFNPDDPAQLAATADEIPEFYRELRAGRAHMEFTPGQTYRIEHNWGDITWPERSDGAMLLFRWRFPPTCAWQVLKSVDYEVRSGASRFPLERVSTRSRVMPELMAVRIPPDVIPSRKAKATGTIVVETKTARWVVGAQPPPADEMSTELRAEFTSANALYPYDQPEFNALLNQRGLRKRAGEADSAFLLRVDRFISRCGYGYGLLWGGFPTGTTGLVQRFAALSCDCGINTTIAGILRANGIPAMSGQGDWMSDTGGKCGSHVRFLAFLQESGWMIGDSTLWLSPDSGPVSRRTVFNGNFVFQALASGLPTQGQEADPPKGAPEVMGRPSESYWRSWRIPSE